jgi:hypothetical protein
MAGQVHVSYDSPLGNPGNESRENHLRDIRPIDAQSRRPEGKREVGGQDAGREQHVIQPDDKLGEFTTPVGWCPTTRRVLDATTA